MLGIIGGTGLYKIEGLEIKERREVGTPFGMPSAPFTKGSWKGRDIVFLPRHGEGHTLLPSEINYCANIYGLKSLGVTKILSVSAVGSLVKEIAPGDLSLPTQYFDCTKGKRKASFFGEGLVAHVSTASPVCGELVKALKQCAEQLKQNLHFGQTYAGVEGPRLGTRAESFFLKNNGCHLVGMTNIPEVFLAKEAQICYATIAVVTDYDCWLEDPHQHVSLEQVMTLYSKTIHKVKVLLENFLTCDFHLGSSHTFNCNCRTSLKDAVITSTDNLSESKRQQLEVLLC